MGLLFFAFSWWGNPAAGLRDCPLHPAAAGLLLAVDHPDWRLAGRARLHCGRGHPRRWTGPAILQNVSPAQAIRELESAILDNPSAGNYEELADLYLDDGNYRRAKACYDKAISSRTDSPDPFYRRGIAEIRMGDFTAAIPDLEHVVAEDPKYDFHLAAALLAHAYANTGQLEKADTLFQQVVKISTASETYYNYATFLRAQGRNAEAREWAAENPGQAAKHAGISAAAGASVVPESGDLVGAGWRVGRLSA